MDYDLIPYRAEESQYYWSICVRGKDRENHCDFHLIHLVFLHYKSQNEPWNSLTKSKPHLTNNVATQANYNNYRNKQKHLKNLIYFMQSSPVLSRSRLRSSPPNAYVWFSTKPFHKLGHLWRDRTHLVANSYI